VIAPAAVLPLFTRARFAAGVRFSEAQKREMAIAYQKTIYTGCASLPCAGGGTPERAAAHPGRVVSQGARRARACRTCATGGLDSYLQVLDSERNLSRASSRSPNSGAEMQSS